MLILQLKLDFKVGDATRINVRGREKWLTKYSLAGPRQGRAEEVSKSSNKVLPTTYKPLFGAWYLPLPVFDLSLDVMQSFSRVY